MSPTTTSSTCAQQPKNWPSNVRYLPRPLASPLLPKSFPLPPHHPPEPSVRIRQIADATHPACGQHGLFAARALKARARILPYHGVYHTAAESDPKSDYDLWVEKEWAVGAAAASPCPSSSSSPSSSSQQEKKEQGEAGSLSSPKAAVVVVVAIGVDAAAAGNEARFVNDYRGVADRPNAEFVVDDGRVWVVATEKGIRKGEEILVSYGKGFWEGRRKEMEMAAAAAAAASGPADNGGKKEKMKKGRETVKKGKRDSNKKKG